MPPVACDVEGATTLPITNLWVGLVLEQMSDELPLFLLVVHSQDQGRGLAFQSLNVDTLFSQFVVLIGRHHRSTGMTRDDAG